LAEHPDATRLVRDHFDFIWRLARRLGLSAEDASDTAQQVFMIAAQKIHELAPGRERAFLYGIALRVTSNLKRKAHRRREATGTEVADAQDGGRSPEQTVELRRACDFLDELLAPLPDDLRRVFVLASVEQLALDEIAELEGIPRGTVASRLRRARELFDERLRNARGRAPFQRE
jgi:RNA polymerase sigma-70 factor (ECF subfamily)